MNKKFVIKIFLLIAMLNIAATNVNAQEGSYAGSFARMGFGARGLSMGNALVSDIYGDVSGYYNPALSCFQDQGYLNLGYTFLTLDRSLNYVGFSKKFNLPNKADQGAGISLSWINAGVGNIDGRDNDTRQTGMLNTFENQFYLGTGFLLDKDFSVGVGFKLYYSKLYDGVKSSTVAFDIGSIYRVMPNLSLGFAVRDISAKYKWDSSPVYGTSGTTTTDKFPTLIDLGGTYELPNKRGSVSLEFETISNPRFETTDSLGNVTQSDRKIEYTFKIGAEYKLTEQFILRGGVDRIDFSADDLMGNIKPGLGIGFYKTFTKNTLLGIDYSFQYEPFTHDGIHNISIGFKFK
jgi:hypothetical protein